jgi:hypothetical protein
VILPSLETKYFKTMNKYLIAIISILVILGVGLNKGTAQVAEPNFMITWETNSLVPNGFVGKVLPTANSQIVASLEIIDAGKFVDLSRITVQWYVDDEFVAGGAGVKNVTFKAPSFPGRTVDLRVQIPNYKNNFIVKTIEIPIVRPESIIEAPYPGGRFTTLSIQVRAVPYFFNVSSPNFLSYLWNVNGETPANSENPDVLNINLNPDAPQGSQIGVSLEIRNPYTDFESANKSINLIFNTR